MNEPRPSRTSFWLAMSLLPAALAFPLGRFAPDYGAALFFSTVVWLIICASSLVDSRDTRSAGKRILIGFLCYAGLLLLNLIVGLFLFFTGCAQSEEYNPQDRPFHQPPESAPGRKPAPQSGVALPPSSG